jgi:hypothetical protein
MHIMQFYRTIDAQPDQTVMLFEALIEYPIFSKNHLVTRLYGSIPWTIRTNAEGSPPDSMIRDLRRQDQSAVFSFSFASRFSFSCCSS